MGFSIKAKRTYSSPYSPKPRPGDTATSASAIMNLANSIIQIAFYAAQSGNDLRVACTKPHTPARQT
jgi:hypothetical protein